MLQHVPADGPIQYSWHTIDGATLLQAMRDNHMEGVVAKQSTSTYVPGDRSDAWLKIKTTRRQEFVVIGWRPPEYGPDEVRGLFLATYEDGELVYRGGVGTGFNNRMRSDVLGVLQMIRRDEPLRVRACRATRPALPTGSNPGCSPRSTSPRSPRKASYGTHP